MIYTNNYVSQVKLLLEVLPVLNEYDCFALKGGTAINLFFRNMLRLSVDIDLTYLPIEPRDIFLKNITIRLKELSGSIERMKSLNVQTLKTKDLQISKLLVSNNDAKIIIEPNFVLRGSVFGCETRTLCEKAQDDFQSYFKIKVTARTPAGCLNTELSELFSEKNSPQRPGQARVTMLS